MKINKETTKTVALTLVIGLNVGFIAGAIATNGYHSSIAQASSHEAQASASKVQATQPASK